MSKYYELTEEFSKIKVEGIFFAFGQKQFDENKKCIPEGEKIYGTDFGMYGTKTGFKAYTAAQKAVEEKIKAECTAQEIYEYEYANHECDYTGDDEEAFDIVLGYFPTADIKRKRAY